MTRSTAGGICCKGCCAVSAVCVHVGAAAFQHDRRIRLYETENNWRLRKDVHCRNLRWTVTDTCLSPDQQYLLYASINPTVHMVWCSLFIDVLSC